MILGRPFCERPLINKWLNFIFKVDDEINHRSGKSVRWKVGVLKNLTSSGEDKSCGSFVVIMTDCQCLPEPCSLTKCW